MTDMPVRKIVRIQGRPGAAEALRAALIELETATRAEPGCRGFQFFQALSDADSFLLVEDFVNQDALQAHFELPHTRAFFARELTAGITPVDKEWLS